MNHYFSLRKRGLALFVALMMCLGMLPGAASAADGHTHNQAGWTCVSTMVYRCEEHTHDDTCKTLTCAIPENHAHKGTVCGGADRCTIEAGHTHSESCYTLACNRNEHTHKGTCLYTEWTCTAPAAPAAPAGPCTACIWRGEVRNEPAACTEPGKTVQLCAICGSDITTIYKTDQEPALGHDWDDGRVTREPAADTDGERTFTCRRNSSHTRTETIPATGTAGNGDACIWRGEVRNEPATCTEPGKTVQLCAICGSDITTIIKPDQEPALGHDWDDGRVTREPTADTDGERTFTCRRDPSHIYTETIPAAGGDNNGPEQPGPGEPEQPGPGEPEQPAAPVFPAPPDTPAAPSNPGAAILDEETPLAGTVGLDTDNHFAYVIGYGDGTVRPLGNITRAEAVTIFFRLMTEEFRTANWSADNSFADVNPGDWHNNAISTCLKAGALEAFAQSGSFLPDQAITRAEFAALAAGFISDGYTGDSVGDFSDTAGHWAAGYIRKAVEAGWIIGEGSAFRPDDSITRADVMAMVNRMLDRVPDAEHMLPDMKTWTDNPRGTSYYADVQEATNDHAYDRDGMGVTEIWSAILESRDWRALEEEWAEKGESPAAPETEGGGE